MSRIAIFFLLLVAPALSLILALLGLQTLNQNLLGWVLLLVVVGTGLLVWAWLFLRDMYSGYVKVVASQQLISSGPCPVLRDVFRFAPVHRWEMALLLAGGLSSIFFAESIMLKAVQKIIYQDGER